MHKILPKTARNEFLHNGKTIVDGLLKDSEIDALIDLCSKNLEARDIFRKSEMLKKMITRKAFLSPLGELSGLSSFRLAMDQVLAPNEKATSLLPLSSQICFQDLRLAILVALKDEPNAEMPYPKQKGEACIFKVEEIISLNPPSGLYYLVIYGGTQTLYKKEPLDPHCHELKSLGLSFGDTLTSETHPIIFL